MKLFNEVTARLNIDTISTHDNQDYSRAMFNEVSNQSAAIRIKYEQLIQGGHSAAEAELRELLVPAIDRFTYLDNQARVKRIADDRRTADIKQLRSDLKPFIMRLQGLGMNDIADAVREV